MTCRLIFLPSLYLHEYMKLIYSCINFFQTDLEESPPTQYVATQWQTLILIIWLIRLSKYVILLKAHRLSFESPNDGLEEFFSKLGWIITLSTYCFMKCVMSFHLCKTIKLILDVVTRSFGWFGCINCIYLVYLGIGCESCDRHITKLHPHVYLYTYFGVGCESCDRHVTKVASTGLFIYLFWGQNG